VLTGCFVEPGLAGAAPGSRFQFERQGYFVVESTEPLVFNRIVGLREAEAKPAPKAEAPKAEAPSKGRTRPPKRPQAEYRAQARARDPELAAAHARILGLGIADDDADLLAGDRATAQLLEEAVAAGADAGAAPRPVIPGLRPLPEDRPRPLRGARLA